MSKALGIFNQPAGNCFGNNQLLFALDPPVFVQALSRPDFIKVFVGL